MCSGVTALLQRLGLTTSQEAVTACQKSAEGIVGWKPGWTIEALHGDEPPKG